ncbi:MAG TPA: helix-turn-helix domain-containing protein [Candidatus Thermoplasmatota archaeon]|nr:helix-turn-helix domain-containing protein [Candidatus Thermoplasmatota archaeon]
MNLWEISFRAQYDYPFIEMSRRYPGTPMSLWCIWNRELFQVPTHRTDVLEAIEKELKKGGWIIEKWGDANGGRTFFLKDTCARWNSIWNIVEPHSGLIAPPAVFADGWCYTRVLSFEEETTRAMFKELQSHGRTELISKRELPLTVLPTNVWVHSLFGDLTDKQKEALLKAHRAGYYNSPRKVGTEDVARMSGVSRSTFEEHLRKGENRVMDALVPYLQLYARGTKEPANLPLKSTPRAAAEAAETG